MKCQPKCDNKLIPNSGSTLDQELVNGLRSDEDEFRDFYELLRSFPELQEKVDRDEDDLYNDILHPVVKVENKFGTIVFGIVFVIVIAVVVQQVFGRVGGV